jgi:hypothetical protein
VFPGVGDDHRGEGDLADTGNRDLRHPHRRQAREGLHAALYVSAGPTLAAGLRAFFT